MVCFWPLRIPSAGWIQSQAILNWYFRHVAEGVTGTNGVLLVCTTNYYRTNVVLTILPMHKGHNGLQRRDDSLDTTSHLPVTRIDSNATTDYADSKNVVLALAKLAFPTTIC